MYTHTTRHECVQPPAAQPSPSKVPGASLVKIGKFVAPEEARAFAPTLRPQSGTISEEDQTRFARMERWYLKAAAERALVGTEFTKKVYRCNRYRIGSEVEIWRNPLRNQASFQKVETCKSVWLCPVCSAKITERRRLELVQAVQAHRDRGGFLAFLTLTVPHHVHDDLGELLDAFLKAHRWMTQQRKSYGRAMEAAGLDGYVRALEVTHGANGWHPHSHAMLFLKAPMGELELAFLRMELLAVWRRACARVGLGEPSMTYGVDLVAATGTTEEVVAQYVTKFGHEPSKVPTWDATHELTKAQSKKGNPRKGRTPWDLLRSLLVEPDNDQDGHLFREYAHAFKRRHLLQATPGLMKRLGVVELTDEEIAERTETDGDELFAALDAGTWQRVAWNQAQAELLDVARLGDLDALCEFLGRLSEPPKGVTRYEGRMRRPRRAELAAR